MSKNKKFNAQGGSNNAVKQTAPAAVADTQPAKPAAAAPAPVVEAAPAVVATPAKEVSRDPIAAFKATVADFCEKTALNKPMSKANLITAMQHLHNVIKSALIQEDEGKALASYKHLMDSMNDDKTGALRIEGLFRLADDPAMWPKAVARREMEYILNIALDCSVPETRGKRARTIEWSVVPDMLMAQHRDIIADRLRKSFGIEG